jgi:hypothetical protein
VTEQDQFLFFFDVSVVRLNISWRPYEGNYWFWNCILVKQILLHQLISSRNNVLIKLLS